MNDFAPIFGILALTVLYGAWHESRSKNNRDAKLLTGVGLSGLAASAAVYLM